MYSVHIPVPKQLLTDAIPAGLYSLFMDREGEFYLCKKEVNTDGLFNLNDPNIERIRREVSDFRKSKKKYKEYEVIYKRGMLLYGPPGNGKSALVNQFVEQAVNEGDVVVSLNGVPAMWSAFLNIVRHNEPERFILGVCEDIDKYRDDPDLTHFLEGDSTVENTMFLCTTNYPELMPERLIRRPGRLDTLLRVGNPPPEVRYRYLVTKVHRFSKRLNSRLEEELNDWVEQTEGFSLAEIKESIIAKEVLGYSIQELKDRRNMSLE
jgi:GTPase SAR1 family protein